MTPLYIFDLDGTLALIKHRRHFVEGEVKDWKSFFAACVDDEPNIPVIRTLKGLSVGGAEIWIWSGRSNEVMEETTSWLYNIGRIHDIPFFTYYLNNIPLKMRKAGDHQPDEKLKAGWLSEISDHDKNRLVAVFDDRDRVVKMWRDAGITCFQVAAGDF